MSLDSFTVSAVIVVLLIMALVVHTLKRSHRDTRVRLEAMEHQIQLAQAGNLLSQEARTLCGAVHKLYPNARMGLDFVIGDGEHGPQIRQWLMPTPEPSEDDLVRAREQYREELEVSGYRHRRLAEYPSIGDQLDALYKARHGDASDLRAIDARIAEIKAKHPAPENC